MGIYFCIDPSTYIPNKRLRKVDERNRLCQASSFFLFPLWSISGKPSNKRLTK
jgi:hypothetical protein